MTQKYVSYIQVYESSEDIYALSRKESKDGKGDKLFFSSGDKHGYTSTTFVHLVYVNFALHAFTAFRI